MHGGILVKSAKNIKYIDQWGQLLPSGHYHGVPHIIGGKLAIIGRLQSANDKRDNKVSTINDGSHT